MYIMISNKLIRKPTSINHFRYGSYSYATLFQNEHNTTLLYNNVIFNVLCIILSDKFTNTTRDKQLLYQTVEAILSCVKQNSSIINYQRNFK